MTRSIRRLALVGAAACGLMAFAGVSKAQGLACTLSGDGDTTTQSCTANSPSFTFASCQEPEFVTVDYTLGDPSCDPFEGPCVYTLTVEVEFPGNQANPGCGSGFVTAEL